MLELILLIFTVFYLLFFYLFLSPGLIVFLVKKHTWAQKGLQLVAFVLGPLAFPFLVAATLMIAILSIAFMVIAYPIYWLHLYFPFGGVFKAWYRVSSRILTRIRDVLQTLLDLALSLIIPAEPKNTIAMPFPLDSSND